MALGFSSSKRLLTSEEKYVLKKMKLSFMDKVEKFFLKWIFFTMITIIPFLLFEEYCYEVKERIEILVVVISQMLSIILSFLMIKRMGDFDYDKLISSELKNGWVEILTIETDFAIKRQDAEDFGVGFYLKIGKEKVIYLTGQLYDVLEYEREIPSTKIKIIQTLEHKIFLEFKNEGDFFLPNKIIPPFSEEQYKIGEVHYDGQVLEMNINNIV